MNIKQLRKKYQYKYLYVKSSTDADVIYFVMDIKYEKKEYIFKCKQFTFSTLSLYSPDRYGYNDGVEFYYEYVKRKKMKIMPWYWVKNMIGSCIHKLRNFKPEWMEKWNI